MKQRLQNLMVINTEIENRRRTIDTIRVALNQLDGNIAQLNKDLGIPACFGDVKQVIDRGGAEKYEALIPQMAVDAMKSGNVTVNPRATTVKDVEALYASLK